MSSEFAILTDSTCIVCQSGAATGTWQLCPECRLRLPTDPPGDWRRWHRIIAWAVSGRVRYHPHLVASTAELANDDSRGEKHDRKSADLRDVQVPLWRSQRVS